jgi:Zn finger protein HypA/HybF involved in hydrogenase expression
LVVDVPEKMRCEKCGSESLVVMIRGAGGADTPGLWPKSTMRGDSLYVFITCPKCGEREQRIGSATVSDA